MSSNHGEYIPMCWDCGDPEFFIVRGLVEDHEMEETLTREDALDGIPRDRYTQPRHAWCRYEFCGEALGNGEHTAELYDAPGRDRFPVTVIEEAK